MAWGDVKLLQETDGAVYLEYTEWQTKNSLGAEPVNIRNVKPKSFATPHGFPERDPVFVYQFYDQKKLGLMQQPDASF